MIMTHLSFFLNTILSFSSLIFLSLSLSTLPYLTQALGARHEGASQGAAGNTVRGQRARETGQGGPGNASVSKQW